MLTVPVQAAGRNHQVRSAHKAFLSVDVFYIHLVAGVFFDVGPD